MQYNTTNHEKDFLFIKEKISEIKIALFKSDINSELQLPVNVIQTLKVEEDGYHLVFYYRVLPKAYRQTILRLS